MINLRRVKTILSLTLAAFLFCGCLYGQSLRRSPVRLGAPKQIKQQKLEKAAEMDVRIGRVVWSDGTNVGVVVGSYTLFNGWDKLFYVCDAKLNVVAVLDDTGIKHRNCRMFAIREGEALSGDTVFLKQIPPRLEED